LIKIDNLKVKNFKSYKDINLNFGLFNLIVGANASGKSNLVNIFKFLHDIDSNGLEDAISQQGDIDWIRNINLTSEENLEIELTLSWDPHEELIPYSPNDVKKYVVLENLTYFFSVKFLEKRRSYEVVTESMVHSLKILTQNKNREKRSDSGFIRMKRENDNILSKLEIASDVLTEKEADFLIPKRTMPNRILPIKTDLKKELLILTSNYKTVSSYFLHVFFKDLQFFDIDPKLAKNSYSITGKSELECDGSNLALVLNKLLRDKEKAQVLEITLKNLLPFVKGISVKQLPDRSCIACLQESYCKNKIIPAPFISDGTINLTALIVALLTRQAGAPAIIIEEPDRNIHPSLISKLAEIMQDFSETYDRQIILTSHNPLFVKSVNLKNLIFIKRKDCFSMISKPQESEEVQEFVKADLGLDKLYYQNLLE
jgi:predicted ATPase